MSNTPDTYHIPPENIKELNDLIMAGNDNDDNIASNTRSKSQKPSQPLTVPNVPKPAPEKKKNNEKGDKRDNINSPSPIRPLPDLGPDPPDVVDLDNTVIAAHGAKRDIGSPGMYPTLLGMSTPSAQSTIMGPPPYDNTWKLKFEALLENSRNDRALINKMENTILNANTTIQKLQGNQLDLRQEMANLKKDRSHDIQQLQHDLKKQELESQQRELNLIQQIQDMESSMQHIAVEQPTAPPSSAHDQRPLMRSNMDLRKVNKDNYSHPTTHQQAYDHHQMYDQQQAYAQGYQYEPRNDYGNSYSAGNMSDSKLFAQAINSNAYQLDDFNGKTPVNIWINQFENYIETTGLDAKLILESKMKSVAQDWFIEMNFRKHTTIEDILKAMRQRFAKTRYQKSQDRAKLMSDFQRPEESKRDWLERAAKQARGLGFRDIDLVDIVVNGVRPERDQDLILGILGDRIEEMNLNDLRMTSMFRIRQNVAFSTNQEDEQVYRMMEPNRSRPQIRGNYNNQQPTTEPKQMKPVQDREATPANRGRSNSRSRSASRDRKNKTADICDRCGKSSPNCESAVQNDNRLCYYYVNSHTCRICSKQGHAESCCFAKSAGTPKQE